MAEATSPKDAALARPSGQATTDPHGDASPLGRTPNRKRFRLGLSSVLIALVAAVGGWAPAEAQTATQSSASTNLCDDPRFSLRYRSDWNRRSTLDGWSIYNNSPGHAGNGVRSASAVTTRHGKLVITAQHQDGQTVSGGLSRRSLSQTYGCYRFRVRTDIDHSNVTSGVVMTWPTWGTKAEHGENDVYETTHRYARRTPFMTFIHKPGDYSGRAAHQHWYRHNADANRYQTMTMVWLPDQMLIQRHGPLANGQWTTDTHQVRPENIPHVAHHPAIQLDARNRNHLAAPVRLEMDWIEVYSYTG
jgi:hypothetical protein